MTSSAGWSILSRTISKSAGACLGATVLTREFNSGPKLPSDTLSDSSTRLVLLNIMDKHNTRAKFVN
ncbi:hypothetical protein DAPPUDRAFT_315060 [Daphnia pulex]|uniref:Uncharacterized protein n=1 Tax=Daphnia pulex TaxID=6669 RepID=E9G8L0_DAPPU|nr:hypothetical protein DAPPUDRAFT_315060 [Daphnia pulex]|eukprot:EFX83991.1 hypothetical protein DAPPUDRAFT_315060 [Daphnia pulex]